MFAVNIYANPKAAHQVKAALAALDGFRAHGVEAKLTAFNEYQPTDLAVLWGHRSTMIMANQLGTGGDYLVMERGYIGDRMNWTSLGFNGLNGHAEFVESDDTTRGEPFRLLTKRWNPQGDYYLICGQVLGDASLVDVNYPDWVNSLPTEHKGKPVYFRPHPVGMAYKVKHEILKGDFAAALAGSAGVWIWNSNSGVDALLAGKPVVAFDKGAMCYDFAAHTLGEPNLEPCVQNMINKLAWCQWTMDEISTGVAWDHLKTRYE